MLRLALGIVFVAICVGCSSRPHTTPRSEMLAEAEENGVILPSIEEDNARFFAYENEQEQRLIDVVRKRSAGEYRDPNYRLGAGDEIEINVFDVPELNLTTVIRQSGFVSLPLLGAVEAKGLTESELNESIANRLTEFMHDPQVSVFIANYGSQKVSVIGAVQMPGRFSLKKGANSILELLSEAGGVSEKAGNYLNFIPGDLSGVRDASSSQRLSNDVRASLDPSYTAERYESQALEIPLERVLGTNGGVPLELPVKSGDMIIVPEVGSVQVDGEVKKVGTYILGKRMTLLGALAAAGGITYGASVEEVELIRRIKGDKVHLVINLEKLASGDKQDLRLKDGDIIRVPSHSGRRMGQDTFDAITQIINFGVGGTVNLAN